MRNFSLKETVEVVGIAAIVASLVFVGLQIRQEKEVAIVDTYGELSQSNIDLTFKVGEQMEIWKKGLDGGKLTEEELGVFSVQAAGVGEYFQRMYIRWTRLGPINPDVAASKYAFALYVFPGLRQEYELNAKFESSLNSARGFDPIVNPWESAVIGYLEKFDRENPPIPANKRYVFWGY
jgi:hypothetical protein